MALVPNTLVNQPLQSPKMMQGGSSATPDDLRKCFDTFTNERCKGKDVTKLRFVIE